jgi:hypothetical protein
MSLNTLSWNLRLSNLQSRSMILARRISIHHKARSFILLLRCVVEPLRDDTTEKSKGRAKGYIANPSKHVIPEVDLPRSTVDLANYGTMGEVLYHTLHEDGKKSIDVGS